MGRCDLRTHGECSCAPSEAPCRAQPSTLEILGEANNGIARHGPWALILLAAIVYAITFYAATKFGTTGI